MFNTKISLYTIMILLSLISNIIVVILSYKKFNISRDEIIGALVYENVGIIVGAKMLTFLQSYSSYVKFDFFSLGLSSYGGVIGAIVCLIIFALQFRKSFKDILFIFMPSIPLMYALGKVGCFLVGCCYGIEYNGLGHIVYRYSLAAPNGVNLFPIQILETFLFMLIFIYMIYNIIKNEFSFKTLGISFVLCGIVKFFLDFLRASHIGIFLSLNQIISIVFMVVGIIIIKKQKNKWKVYSKM